MPQFRAKARAVDLLGKGQIADLPTAISELWKNGYDAYGDVLESYLYMPGYLGHSDPTFVISDDGKGMTKDDIINKWFVLGTDSKSRREYDVKGEETLFKEPRVKMGEKGIGRLAVAYLGPQMLMLTKKRFNLLETIFFDWRILENYDLFLEDINIPNRTIESISEIPGIFEDLKKEFLLNFPEIKESQKDPWKDQKELKDTIIQECRNLKLPKHLIDDHFVDLVENPEEKHATRFLIFKPDAQILDLKNFIIQNENRDLTDDYSIRHTISTLVALFNLFKTDNPQHTTAFWIKSEEGKYDLLKSKSFFTPDDFDKSDHLIDGHFNEFGEFNGKIRIYKKEIQHNYIPIKRKTISNYGPFELKLGYIAGIKNESTLNDDQWIVFDQKLDLFSGLYIYRDGFRVLPYGRSDNDFLEFEERRGKHAGEFFFAKRRMFGYIEIKRKENSKLIDKSSREGFVNNVAYRDFKINLIAFFIDLAKKYFGTKAEYSYKEQQKAELTKLAKAEENEKKRDIEARKQFSKQLKEYPQKLDFLEEKYNSLIKLLKNKLTENNLAFDEVKVLLTEIDQYKIKIQDFNLTKPVRFKASQSQAKNFYSYQKQYSNFQKIVEDSNEVVFAVREKLKVQDLFNEFEGKYKLFHNILKNQFIEYESQLKGLANKLFNGLEVEQQFFILDFESKYKSILPTQSEPEDIIQSLELLESVFSDTREKISNRISPYLAHLDRLSFDVSEDNLVGFYKIQFEEMKEEWNKTYELAQLGIAVEIIDHQFNTLYSQLSESIKSLKVDIKENQSAIDKYHLIENAFNHLEDNYKLLQPLYRTTGRIRKNITGYDLFEYTLNFFASRLEQNDIEFRITEDAKTWTEFSYESIFKPVLINIINNAIYWLQPVKDRKIIIDSKDNKLLIMNSGLQIEDHLLDDIFNLFFSERPKGRGIGLYLARKSLNGIGFEIYATNESKYNSLHGACFVIESIKK